MTVKKVKDINSHDIKGITMYVSFVEGFSGILLYFTSVNIIDKFDSLREGILTREIDPGN